MKTKPIPNLKFQDLGNPAFSVPTPKEHIQLNSVILLVAKKQSGKTFFATNLMNQLKLVQKEMCELKKKVKKYKK